MVQGGAVGEFHGEKGAAIFFANLINRADVWMVQCRGCPGFAPKSLYSMAILGHILGKEFECDKAVEPSVLGLVDYAHPAAADLGYDAVMRNGGADHGRNVRARRKASQ